VVGDIDNLHPFRLKHRVKASVNLES
jgi:hypothetical protein